MATLNLTGDVRNDPLLLTSVMLWPAESDAARRLQYMAASHAQDLLRGDEESHVLSRGHIAALLDAPSWGCLREEITERTKRATIAGYVFAFMALMDRYEHLLPPRGEPGGTLNKAFSITEAWAKTNVLFGDGTALYANQTSIKKCWADYRPVSHLWATMEFNKADSMQFASDRGVFSSLDSLRAMLRRAAHLQTYGQNKSLTNKSKAASQVLLPSGSSWLVDPQEFPPLDVFPKDDEGVTEAPWLQFLKRYTAT